MRFEIIGSPDRQVVHRPADDPDGDDRCWRSLPALVAKTAPNGEPA
jgi:hypothetical protein